MVKKLPFTAKAFIFPGLALGFLAAFWYTFIALEEEPIPRDEIVASYSYQAPDSIEISFSDIGKNKSDFSYRSFDRALVNVRISYPPVKRGKYPVLIGISATGRGYQRWWVDSFKGRPTVTKVNEITGLASREGYVAIAIDARYHGTRKDPSRSLRSIMNDLHFFGNKSYYEEMIRNTVLGYRVLIDWITGQPNLDSSNITLAGYSMGTQVALLTAALEQLVNRVIAKVPPHILRTTMNMRREKIAGACTMPLQAYAKSI